MFYYKTAVKTIHQRIRGPRFPYSPDELWGTLTDKLFRENNKQANMSFDRAVYTLIRLWRGVKEEPSSKGRAVYALSRLEEESKKSKIAKVFRQSRLRFKSP